MAIDRFAKRFILLHHSPVTVKDLFAAGRASVTMAMWYPAFFWSARMRKLFLTGFLGLAACTFMGPGIGVAADKVEVAVVKYSGLADAVKKLRSKVVVVDFWATY